MSRADRRWKRKASLRLRAQMRRYLKTPAGRAQLAAAKARKINSASTMTAQPVIIETEPTR